MADGGGFNVAIVRHFWRDSGPRSDKRKSHHEIMIDTKKNRVTQQSRQRWLLLVYLL
jgi:hypothetical protein